jgi:hypothetical protein
MAPPKVKRSLSAAADVAGEGLSGVKQVNAKKVGDAMTSSGGEINDSVVDAIRKGDNDMIPLGNVLKNAEIPSSATKKNLKAVSDLVEDVPAGDIAKRTGSTLAETADAMKKADSFFKRNEKALLAAGISAAGLGTYMLLTGETDPAKAVGKIVGEVAGAAGKGLGSGLKGLFEGSGLGELFKGVGVYIIGFFAFILFIFAMYMFFG